MTMPYDCDKLTDPIMIYLAMEFPNIGWPFSDKFFTYRLRIYFQETEHVISDFLKQQVQ